MTQNEVDILKNSVLDGTEAYVEARLQALDFVKTQIGVTVGNPEKRDDKKYYHVVRCNATRQNPKGITYNNVLSVGNQPFPANCVVFLVAPNAQFSNQFILGQLDDTPVNITAGSITLGGDDPNTAPIHLTGTPISDGKGGYYYGRIGSFYIYNNQLKIKDALISENVIGCGSAGYGIINLVGGQSDDEGAYLQISDDGTPFVNTYGIRIYNTGKVESTLNTGWTTKYLGNIPDAGFGEMLLRYIETNPNTGDLRWKT